MFPIIDLIATLGGLVAAPAYDFIKKKFLKPEVDTPESTIGTLATTKPESLEGYVKSLSEYTKSKIDFFNRDVIGQCSQWVVNLRASIRPIVVIMSLLTLIGMAVIVALDVDVKPELLENLTGIRISCEAIVSSWMGDRFSISKNK
uniref:Uncharacterized protein n=1 Tax=viral metagenome TaxID=1070528 RepID=A0A6M3XV56_9ZZZZ